MYWDKCVTKLFKKCPLHLKCVLALPLEIWSDRFNHQRSTYMYILINHRIATNTSGSHCLKKIVKRVESYIIFTWHAGNVHLWRCIENEWTVWIARSLKVRLACGASVYVLAFVLETDISSIRCKDDVTYYTFDDFRERTASGFVAIQWFIKMYMWVLRWQLNLSLQISQGSASTRYRLSGHFLHSFVSCFF